MNARLFCRMPVGAFVRPPRPVVSFQSSAAVCSEPMKENHEYLTLARKHVCETEVKKSKFIAYGWPIGNSKQALELIEAEKHKDASHNCFAYKVGDEFRAFDDGEPGGTAGKPILGSIEGEGLDGVCVMVTRYFGGTKLGAGGLVRAYGAAARSCLREAEKIVFQPSINVQIQAPFDRIGLVYQLADQFNAVRLSEEYSESGSIVLKLNVQLSRVDLLNDSLRDATSARLQAHPY